jgi:hypothetical protein
MPHICSALVTSAGADPSVQKPFAVGMILLLTGVKEQQARRHLLVGLPLSVGLCKPSVAGMNPDTFDANRSAVKAPNDGAVF